MTDCIEKLEIESFVAGTANAMESKKVLDHLDNCPKCQQQAIFISALRLSLAQRSKTEDDPNNPCLSNELLSLMIDEALPESEQKQALAHLADCESCLSDYLTLQKALEEAALNPQNPPEHLLKKAKALGKSSQNERTSILQRFLGPSPALRFALATSAAACVFVLTLVISSNTPPPTGLSPKGTVALANKHQTPTPPDYKPDQNSAPEAIVAEMDKTGQPKPITLPNQEAGWLATMPDGKKADLLAHFYPNTKNTPFGSTALTNRYETSTTAVAYRVGKSLAAIDTFSGQLNKSPLTRKEITRSLNALSLQVVLLSAQEGETLKGFAKNLADKVTDARTSTDSLVRRLSVLQMAIQESLPTQKISASYKFGQKVSSLELAAVATQAGQTSKPFDSFDLQDLKSKAGMLQLKEKEALAINANLDKLIKLQKVSSGPIPYMKVLEIIEKLEEIILQQ